MQNGCIAVGKGLFKYSIEWHDGNCKIHQFLEKWTKSQDIFALENDNNSMDKKCCVNCVHSCFSTYFIFDQLWVSILCLRFFFRATLCLLVTKKFNSTMPLYYLRKTLVIVIIFNQVILNFTCFKTMEAIQNDKSTSRIFVGSNQSCMYRP